MFGLHGPELWFLFATSAILLTILYIIKNNSKKDRLNSDNTNKIKNYNKQLRCPACQNNLLADVIYCTNCGINIKDHMNKQESISCANCGQYISKEDKFCTQCGINL